ncbi:MAG: NAD(+) synthase [Candidatus Omnitrophica bacterium]|nr:NAD(+) synthase [Candidatus Omnitrophota bacterium]
MEYTGDKKRFSKDILRIDCEKETARICDFIRQYAINYNRDGAVVGISGGIDSAVTASICVKALGKEKVFGLILPEKESLPESANLAKKQAEKLGISYEVVNITPTLEGFGTYQKRDTIVREIFPDYTENCKIKITLPPDLLHKDALNFFTLQVIDEKGNIKSKRLNKNQLNGLVAATCTKQRTRMMHLYYYAEKMNYFVCGTTNKSESIQGLFVKHGDGGVDIEPIVHLYKNQVFQLADYLGVIKEVQERTPTPDTWSFTVSDEEFYFRIPFDKLDLLLFAWEYKIPLTEVCKTLELNEEQIKRVYRDFNSKFNATKHLRELPPTLDVWQQKDKEVLFAT